MIADCAFCISARRSFCTVFLQACALHGLDQVVHRLGFKGLHGVLVVGGDEHQRRKRLVGGSGVGQRPGDVQPRLAGHADIEEQHIGLQCGAGVGAVPGCDVPTEPRAVASTAAVRWMATAGLRFDKSRRAVVMAFICAEWPGWT